MVGGSPAERISEVRSSGVSGSSPLRGRTRQPPRPLEVPFLLRDRRQATQDAGDILPVLESPTRCQTFLRIRLCLRIHRPLVMMWACTRIRALRKGLPRRKVGGQSPGASSQEVAGPSNRSGGATKSSVLEKGEVADATRAETF